MQTHALRLIPGQDLKKELDDLVVREKWAAVCVLTAVGSLTRVALRYADRSEITISTGHFEIVSMCGTLSAEGGSHLHLAVSDETGRTIGGHLKEGAFVYTTAEIVLGILTGLRFTRAADPKTGYPELKIEKRQQ